MVLVTSRDVTILREAIEARSAEIREEMNEELNVEIRISLT